MHLKFAPRFVTAGRFSVAHLSAKQARPAMFLGVVWSALALILAAPATGRDIVLTKSKEVLEAFRANCPQTVECSPDGGLVLLRRKDLEAGGDGEELLIKSVGGEEVRFQRKSKAAHLRIKWRPDGKAISYFRQDLGTNRRRLYIWDLATGVEEEVGVPETYAQRQVRWSPDGRKLAYTSSSDGIYVFDFDTKKGTWIAGNFTDFDWDPQSKRIAAIFSKPENKLQVASLSGETRSKELPGQLKLRDLSWQNGVRILLRAYDPGTKKAKILTIEPSLEGVQELLSSDQAIGNVAWTWKGGIAFGVIQGVEKHIHTLNTPGLPPVINTPGVTDVQSISAGRETVYASRISPEAYDIVTLNAAGASRVAGSFAQADATLIHQSVAIKSGPNREIYAWASSFSDKEEAAIATVILVSGGTTVDLGFT
jgi:WD40 repeat protein